MSDVIKHECGIAMIRLRKPLSYFIEKYGTPAYAINKLYLLMEKQKNRGQDGAGVGIVKINQDPGKRFMTRLRSADSNCIQEIFSKMGEKVNKNISDHPNKSQNAKWIKNNNPYIGELYLGHLRYGTHGKNSVKYCHPMVRRNSWRNRNLLVAGNFNMTNVDELYENLISLGQHPIDKGDTVTVMEKIGHFLDVEVQELFDKYKKKNLSNVEISDKIEDKIDIHKILLRSCKDFDGGYAMAGLIGHGGSFVARDPAGIRPAYYYADDEIVVVASEKPAIKTAFNVEYEDIQEIDPGHALIINKKGNYKIKPFTEQLEKKSCSFERIYFSRGTDPDIYNERKKLGNLLIPQIMDSVKGDLENTLFSYIPNTAETSFLGMVQGLDEHTVNLKINAINNKKLSKKELANIMHFHPRVEKLVIKDKKLRTFITDDAQRDELVSHVYDTTYGIVKSFEDTIVVIDDSIVRGTTLEKSILKLLNRLEPKKIVIVSSAPQIRYPDCYGIDMSRMHEFIAFRAMLALLKDTQQEYLLQEVYEKCKASLNAKGAVKNYVKELYAPFTYEQVSNKVAEIITTPEIDCEVEVIFQTVENLHKACPNHIGDWYFTGDYPTAGGSRVVNKAFVYFMEGKNKRAY